MSTADPAMIMAKENIYLSPESSGWFWRLSAGLGVIFIALTVVGGMTAGGQAPSVALHAYHVGFLASLGLALGSLGFVMIFHQTNAGWVASIRRQFENVMSLIWVPAILCGGLVIMQWAMWKKVYLFPWMDPEHTAGDVIYQHKSAFLNIPFFGIRALVYFAIWGLLSFLLYNYSVRQDHDGDRWHTAAARKLSAIGLPLFAFTTAFAGFDWLMSLDYHWFSTMFGVWFFAGNAVSTMALVTLVLIMLRFNGRMHGAFNEDHLHDMGKLLFAFVVFWAYISFSQYFLIWYADLPEETGFFIGRKVESFGILSWVIPICHFIVPFLWLLPRPGRRSMLHVGVACVWILVMHLVDLYFVVRPEAGAFNREIVWIDIVGVLGPVLLFIGAVARQVGRGPLIPLKDPRLHEALEHKNYV